MRSIHPLLPPIHRPPHDPTSLLLNARAGWRAALLEDIEERADGNLALALPPGSKRSFDEPGGSLGGLTLPTNTALGPDGSLFLLDPRGPVLKWFDPCACRFETVPCFGGAGNGPRELSTPHGIGICSGNLFVCDTGNHRVGLFALHGFALRGHWNVPPDAGMTNPWEPYDIAFDGRGRAYLSDGANGCIHRFTRDGRYEKSFPGFGGVTHLAMDCHDRLYAALTGPPVTVRILDRNGNIAAVTDSPAKLASLFPQIPFPVDRKGRLHMGALCVGSESSPSGAPEKHVFDLNGEAATAAGNGSPAYPAKGVYISQALDSRLYRCRWHRVILHGTIPEGSRVQVDTFTAETELNKSQLLNLPADQWETRQLALEMDEKKWDCLVRSAQGRFLWLKLQLRGNRRVSPSLDSVEIEFPRISLRRYLPAVFGAEPVSADFTDRFLSLFDTTLRNVEGTIDTLSRYFDPSTAPAESMGAGRPDFLTWLGTWIGIALDRRWPEKKRRAFLKRAGSMFRLRGTRQGLWRLLVFYLGMEAEKCCCSNHVPKSACTPANLNCARPVKAPCHWQPPPLILEHFCIRRWLFLGAGRLSDQAVLWGKNIVNRTQLDENARADSSRLKMTQDPYRDPFHVYAHKFSVFVPAKCGATDTARKSLATLLKTESPAHTAYFVHYVKPRFRVGIQATIGFDSVVARISRGVTLPQSTLGKDAVLNEPPYRQGGPHFELGDGPRVGTTALLD